jgi:hypothetical protein
MDELRTFELELPHRAQSLRLGRTATLCALDGPLWVTVEGDFADIWLQAGERVEIGAGQRIWLSAERNGARFTVLTRDYLAGIGLNAVFKAMFCRLRAGRSSSTRTRSA